MIDGKAVAHKASKRRSEIGVDYLEAAHSRIRQLQAHNAYLETQVRRLKTKLEEIEAESAVHSAPTPGPSPQGGGGR